LKTYGIVPFCRQGAPEIAENGDVRRKQVLM